MRDSYWRRVFQKHRLLEWRPPLRFGLLRSFRGTNSHFNVRYVLKKRATSYTWLHYRDDAL